MNTDKLIEYFLKQKELITKPESTFEASDSLMNIQTFVKLNLNQLLSELPPKISEQFVTVSHSHKAVPPEVNFKGLSEFSLNGENIPLLGFSEIAKEMNWLDACSEKQKHILEMCLLNVDDVVAFSIFINELKH